MKTNKVFIAVLFALIVNIPNIATASAYCDALVVGASYADRYWPVVTDAKGNETVYSRNALLDGKYRGLCDALGLLSGMGKISCPAVAGSMSFDLTVPFGSVRISAPGFMTQLAQGVKECTWNGRLHVNAVIISLANDGPTAIMPTRQLVDAVLNLGVSPRNILVQAYPTQMPDFQREHDTALEKHGPFWGLVINSFGSVPSQAEYAALKGAHAQALNGYKGVQYLDIYKGVNLSGNNTFDGVHPKIIPQILATLKIKNALR